MILQARHVTSHNMTVSRSVTYEPKRLARKTIVCKYKLPDLMKGITHAW